MVAPPSFPLSVVVPLRNERLVLEELFGRIERAAGRAVERFEVVAVDDASTDGTGEWLAARASNAFVHHRLDRRHGQFRVTCAGLAVARGEWIATLDGDLQDPPELIPRLWEVARASGDVPIVVAAKTERCDRGWVCVGAGVYHALLAALAQARVPRGTGSYALMRREVARSVAKLPFRDANLGACLVSLGLPVERVDYVKGARRHGRSKVGAVGLVREALGSLALSGALPRALRMASLSCVLGAPLTAGVSLAGAAVLRRAARSIDQTWRQPVVRAGIEVRHNRRDAGSGVR